MKAPPGYSQHDKEPLYEPGYFEVKRPARVWAMSCNYDGDERVRCVHATEDAARACQLAQAKIRIGGDEPNRDADGTLWTSQRECFKVKALVVQGIDLCPVWPKFHVGQRVVSEKHGPGDVLQAEDERTSGWGFLYRLRLDSGASTGGRVTEDTLRSEESKP